MTPKRSKCIGARQKGTNLVFTCATRLSKKCCTIVKNSNAKYRSSSPCPFHGACEHQVAVVEQRSKKDSNYFMYSRSERELSTLRLYHSTSTMQHPFTGFGLAQHKTCGKKAPASPWAASWRPSAPRPAGMVCQRLSGSKCYVAGLDANSSTDFYPK